MADRKPPSELELLLSIKVPASDVFDAAAAAVDRNVPVMVQLTRTRSFHTSLLGKQPILVTPDGWSEQVPDELHRAYEDLVVEQAALKQDPAALELQKIRRQRKL